MTSNLKPIIKQKHLVLPQREPDPSNPYQVKEIPGRLSFTNTKKIPGLDNKLMDMSVTNDKAKFYEKITKVLELYDVDQLHISYDLVVFVMNEIERFILQPKRGAEKKELAVRILLRFFNDNQDFTESIIELAMRDLKKVGMLGRMFRRTYRSLYHLLIKKKRESNDV
jgi:hypothetical protein